MWPGECRHERGTDVWGLVVQWVGLGCDLDRQGEGMSGSRGWGGLGRGDWDEVYLVRGDRCEGSGDQGQTGGLGGSGCVFLVAW